MQEELFRTLRRVGISDETVELETVTLSREQNLLTVFFRCEREFSIPVSQKLACALEEKSGGARVRVVWLAEKPYEPETPAKAAITAAFTQSRDELAGRVVSQVDAAENAMGIASARLSLMVTEPDYALMYFYMPLIAAGCFCLLFSAALLSLWLRYDERKRARVKTTENEV